jgi:predicted RNase H-like HicB family nuclease
VEASVEFKLPARVRKKGNWFISSCPALDVYSQGRTREEAERNLVDALKGFFLSCYERGSLDAVLRDAGFAPMPQRRPRAASPRGGIMISVPLPFVISTRARRVPAAA